MQYTDVFGFKKPEYAEEADVVDLNDNMDDIDDTLYKIRRLSGLVYDANTTSSNPYVAGNYTINPTDGLMYKCTDTTYGAWDSTKWTRTDEFTEIELAMQSGGGGGGSAYTETTLWSGSETPDVYGSDINLSENISDYDMIAIHVGDSSYSGDNIFIVDNLTIGETYISTVYHGGNLGAFFTYTSDTQINIKAQGSNYPQTYTKVVGISFGSGGGSGSGYSETSLWTGPETPSTSGTTITLNDNLSDYDMIYVNAHHGSYTNEEGSILIAVSSLTVGGNYVYTVYDYDMLYICFEYSSNTQLLIKTVNSNNPITYTEIVGIKFGSGGGGSSSGGTHYSTTEQVVGTWIDGSDVYERVYDYSSNLQSIGTSYTDFSDIDTTNISKMIYACAIHQDGTVYPSIDADPTRSNHTILGLKSFDSHTNIAYVILRYTKQV